MTPYQHDRHHLLRHASGRGATRQLNGKRKRHAITLPTIRGCMTDIVERLHQVQGDNDDAREAAAEIIRLRAENEKFRTAIRVAVKALEPFPPASLSSSKRIIRLVKDTA